MKVRARTCLSESPDAPHSHDPDNYSQSMYSMALTTDQSDDFQITMGELGLQWLSNDPDEGHIFDPGLQGII